MKYVILCLACLVLSRSTLLAAPQEIRVKILKDVQRLEVEARDIRALLRDKGPVAWEKRGLGRVSITKGVDGFLLNDVLIRSHQVMLTANSPFRLQGRELRGFIEISDATKGNLFLVVNRLPLERYIAGLLNHEISSAWPMESLKAQAVVARSYAMFRRQQRKYPNYDLESSTADQVYSGSHLEDARSLAAVEKTENEVLTVNGKVIAAFYHSCCGGKTELAQHVWGTPYLGNESVVCTYCTDAPNYFWTHEIPTADLQERLQQNGFPLAHLQRVRVLRTSPFGRALVIGVEGPDHRYQLTGNQFRRIVGFQDLYSTFFRISGEETASLQVDKVPSTATIRFIGGGNGHGVGMCQWGAYGMASQKFSYREILKHYYPSARIRHL